MRNLDASLPVVGMRAPTELGARTLVQVVDPAQAAQAPGARLELPGAADPLSATRWRALDALDALDATNGAQQVLQALVDALTPPLADVAVARVVEIDGPVTARAARTPALEAALRAVEPHVGVATQGEPPLGRALLRLDGPRVVSPTEDVLAALADHRLAEAARALSLRSVLVAPLRAGFCVGLLAVGAVDRVFRADDLALAQALARRAGLLLEAIGARARLERAVRTRERLLSQLRHDLVNPASAVHMAATVLLKRLAPGEERQAVERIHRSAEQLTHMIQGICDESAREASRGA